MRILYISCHATLEFEEVSLLSELGHDVFSTGVYAYPKFRDGLPRPGIDSLVHYPEMERLASTIDTNGGEIPEALIDWAEIVIFMHRPEWLEKNWFRLKNKKVVFRSIGQNVSSTESLLKPLKQEGLKIVRYSPSEKKLPGYVGEDAIIRFYKDESVFNGYTGEDKFAINITQSIRQRGKFCHYGEIKTVLKDFPAKIFGNGNEDLGSFYGGKLSYEGMIEVLRKNRVFVYGGTWPAPYTLSLMEAMMVGMPVVSIGRHLAEDIPGVERVSFFEIPDMFSNERNIFFSDDTNKLREYVSALLEDHNLAKTIGEAGRQMAIELWGKEKIAKQWRDFLNII